MIRRAPCRKYSIVPRVAEKLHDVLPRGRTGAVDEDRFVTIDWRFIWRKSSRHCESEVWSEECPVRGHEIVWNGCGIC